MRVTRFLSSTAAGLAVAAVGLGSYLSFPGFPGRQAHSQLHFVNTADAVTNCPNSDAIDYLRLEPSPGTGYCSNFTEYTSILVGIRCLDGTTYENIWTNIGYPRCFKNGTWRAQLDNSPQNPPEQGIQCESLCPSGRNGGPRCDKNNHIAKPITLSSGEVWTRIPLFPIADVGFPAAFEIFWNQFDTLPHPGVPPLGPHTSTSLQFSLWKGTDSTGNHAVLQHEDGFSETFSWISNAWVSDNGSRTALNASAPGTTPCPSSATATLEDGTQYSFHDYCLGSSPTEGTPSSLTRPDGQTLTYTISSLGQIATVTNSRGVAITFGYGFAADAPGPLVTVLTPAPAGQAQGTYTLVMTGDSLTSISNPDGSTEWSLTYDTGNRLTALVDGGGVTQNSWSYGTNTTTESGPGTSGANSLAVTFSGSTASVAFTPAGGSTPVTNLYSWDAPSGTYSHVTSRAAAGECTNCGATALTRSFWPGTNDLQSTTEDGGSSFVVYEDFGNPTHAGAYDAVGNPLIVNRGCTAASQAGCANAYTLRYQYAGTQGWSQETRPSALGSGATVTNDRCFDGRSSSRVTLLRKRGNTASTLNGTLDVTAQYATEQVYSGIDVAEIDGPFADTSTGCATLPTPPANAPKTTYAYYATGEVDACTRGALATDAHRLKSITRFGDTANLVTFYCSYDPAGNPQTIWNNNDNATTSLTYDAKERVIRRVVDSAGLALRTDFAYDGAGRLVNLYLPRSTTNGRTGYRLQYDNSGRVFSIQHGYFAGTLTLTATDAITSLETEQFTYDAWGNRTSSATATQNSTQTFNAFNKVASLTRNINAVPTSETYTYSYDSLNRLASAMDFQGDAVQYSWDRFGNLSSAARLSCAHTTGNGPIDATPCGAASPVPTPAALITYTYDAALRVASVTLNDSKRAGSTTTSYTTDDFGKVVKIVSPDAGTLSAKYDALGHLTDFRDGNGKTWQFIYDRLGRLVQKKNGGTGVVENYFCYDGYDHTGGGGAGCGFTVDQPRSAGRLTAVQDKLGGVQYFYDNAGRLTQESRGVGAWLLTNHSYDANSNETQTSFNGRGPAIARTFDDTDHETLVQWTANGTTQNVASAISYYPFGGLKGWTMSPGFAETLFRDVAGRITESKLVNGATLKADWTYAYAADGNVYKRPASAGGTYNTNHDSMNRITLDFPGISYTNDDRGNRITQNGANLSFASGTNNRLLTGPNGVSYSTYDAAGNVTARTGVTSITHADDGTVTSITTASGTTTYGRDWRGLRYTTAGPGGSGTYDYAPNGDMQNWTGPQINSSCSTLLFKFIHTINYETYVRVGGFLLATVKSHVSTACGGSTFGSLVVDGVYSYWPNKDGAPDAIYNPSGICIWNAPNDFDANGNPITINDDLDGDGVHTWLPFRLPGQYALTTAEGGPTTTAGGLWENWHRVYDSVTGRYLEPDPIFFTEGNSYVYANGSPLRFIDPSGQSAEALYDAGRRVVLTVVPDLAPKVGPEPLAPWLGPLAALPSLLWPSPLAGDDEPYGADGNPVPTLLGKPFSPDQFGEVLPLDPSKRKRREPESCPSGPRPPGEICTRLPLFDSQFYCAYDCPSDEKPVFLTPEDLGLSDFDPCPAGDIARNLDGSITVW